LFVKERLRDYRARTGAEIRVVAPVPWVPWMPWMPRALAPMLPAGYAAFARTPREETFEGFPIVHPRYAMLPKVGVWWQGRAYWRAARGAVARLRGAFPFELIDAHYAYPDGYAAALLKRELRVPLVLTVRGTDVNLLPRLAATRAKVRAALQAADAVVAVSRALADLAVAAGADAAKVTVLRNGVDPARFAPRDRMQSRARFGLAQHARVIASVGLLIPRKGHDLVLEAVARLPAAERPAVLIAGAGPEEARLRAQARALGLDRNGAVRFLGGVPHDDLPAVYSAADLLVLASSREGWPNVLLEAMACGTPVLATAVHGSPEVVSDAAVGRLVQERTVPALSGALAQALATPFDRAAVRRHAEGMTWEATSAGLDRVFRGVLGRAGSAP
jgi:glycosyltransferase involved in cell wall biosynthesis